jgi:hypothetical protein
MTNKGTVQDILTLASFIAWQEPRTLVGGYRAEDAYSSMCKLLNLDPNVLRTVVGPTNTLQKGPDDLEPANK